MMRNERYILLTCLDEVVVADDDVTMTPPVDFFLLAAIQNDDLMVGRSTCSPVGSVYD
jgi:hypothetical protein